MVDLVQDENGRFACKVKQGTPARTYYITFYHYYDATIYSYLPLSSMLVFNSLIVAKLISARVRKHGGSSTAGGSTAGGSTSGGSTAGGTAMSKVSDSVTVMLVAVCVLFAVTTTPYAAMYNVNSDVSTLKYALMIQGIYINHSANIFIYLIFNKRFRSECKAILCGKSSKVEPGRRNDSIQLEANHTSAEYA